MSSTVMYIFDHWAEISFGIAIVAFYAYGRFNTPPTIRWSTTTFRYHVAAALYAGTLVGAYLGLTLLSSVFQPLITLLKLPDVITRLSPPLLYAVLFTVVLPKNATTLAADDRIRNWFYRLGYIPHEVQRLSRELRRAVFTPDAATLLRVKEQLEDGDPLLAWVTADNKENYWIRCAVILQGIDEISVNRSWNSYLDDFEDEWEGIDLEFDSLSAGGRRLIAFGTVPGDDAETKALGELRRAFTAQAKGLFERLTLFTAQGLLRCYGSDPARIKGAHQIGIAVTDLTPPRATWDMLIPLFLLLLTGLIFVFVFSGQDSNFGQRLAQAVKVSAAICLSVQCAIYPRELFKPGLANAQKHDFKYYLVVGILASIATWVFSVLFNFTFLPLSDAVARLGTTHPWMILAFSLAFGTAYCMDNKELGPVASSVANAAPEKWRPALTQYGLRIIESTGLAIVSAIAAVFVILWLQEIRPIKQKHPYLIVFEIGVIGALIGAWVPSWYRDAPRPPTSKDNTDDPSQMTAPPEEEAVELPKRRKRRRRRLTKVG